MKKFFMYVAGFMFLTVFPACSDDDSEQTSENPVSEEQQAIDDMVEALETQPYLSDFMNWLSVVDMSGVDGAQFTAFAPKNGTGNGTEFSRAETLTEETIGRHVVVGSYTKDQLIEGLVLKSVNGENVYVTRDGDNVRVNGIVIEGDGISAGKGRVFTVTEPLEERAAAYYVTKIQVNLLTKGNPEPAPLEGVTVTVYDENDVVIGTWKTDASGIALVEHVQPTIYYAVSKEGYSDTVNGWLVVGIDENGEYMYVDYNGDGVLDNNDVITEKYSWYHGDTEVESAPSPCYMVPVE
ncbi:fasciclin domain-containing protein [Phocaeicola salanitronis]|uniref:fasciclin domain-containing protein n=1 Tax=Phocaeicola salanitronis TaxID=376805 RepID=UPI0025A4C583|nr:fasciclin domain-containing protein [Phocaeicola salanitronis]MDM8306591.1 fasciclin domain-containing protein [Phocaeicola salanitronis]